MRPSTAPLHRDPYARDVFGVFGLPFDCVTLEAAGSMIVGAGGAGERLWVSTVNLDWVRMARSDSAFAETIRRSDLVTCDGAPVLRLAALAGAVLPGRVTGADLFETLRNGTAPALRTFFFGGREGAAVGAAEALAGRAKGLTAAGAHNPGFGDVAAMSTSEHLAPVNDADPDLLIVAIGAAKGQHWLAHNADKLRARVISHWGAVVDFAAGTINRAPKWVQALHLEWAFRIAEEPALWRRYAGDATLLPALLREALQARAAHRALARFAGAEAGIGGTGSDIALAGDVEGRGLPALRDALRRADAAAGDLIVEMAGGTRIGPRTLGLLMLAVQRAADRGCRADIVAVDGPTRVLLHINHLPLSTLHRLARPVEGAPPEAPLLTLQT